LIETNCAEHEFVVCTVIVYIFEQVWSMVHTINQDQRETMTRYRPQVVEAVLFEAEQLKSRTET
jgi:uncharacterized membrane protein